MIKQYAREDTLRHKRYAEELECNRMLIVEDTRSHRKRIRAVDTSMQLDGDDLLQESQPGYARANLDAPLEYR